MSNPPAPGRHRAAGRHNPLTEISGMVARAGESGVKASAVLAASGGLIAAFALPAQAAPATTSVANGNAAAATTTARPAAPAVVAPQAQAPAALSAAGISGVSAVEKPPPPPPPPPVVETPAPAPAAASRSTTRAAVSTKTTTATTTVREAPANYAGLGIVGTARALLGIPYVYGGTTPAGFDCSGFTSYVYAQNGISIPRTATAQMNASTIVSDPQPGDLVFFVSGGTATHVGIYTGGGMMIDSPRTGKSTSERAIYSTNVVYGRF